MARDGNLKVANEAERLYTWQDFLSDSITEHSQDLTLAL